MAPGNPVVSALKELFMTVVQHQTEIMINHAQQQETILEQRRVSQRLLENMCESIGHQMGNVNAVMGGKVDDETLQALVAARDSIQPPAPSHVEYVLQVAGEQARHPATGFVPFARRREFSAEDTLRHDNYDEDTRVAELFRNHGNSFSHREDGWYWQDRMMGFANRQGPTPSSHGNPHRHSYGSLSDSPPRFHGHLMTPSEVSRRPKGAWSGENLYSHTIDTRLTENIIKATNRVSKEVLQAILLEVLNAVPDIHKGNLHDHVLNMVRGREGPQNYPLRSSHWPVTVSPGVGYMGYFKLPIECEFKLRYFCCTS